MGDTLERAKLLAELGYGHPQASLRAVEILTAANLTNPRKTGIAAAKRERVQAVLQQALLRLCARCMAQGQAHGQAHGLGQGHHTSGPDEDREAVPTQDQRHCERCGGSANRLAVDRAAAACRRSGIRRVVVVGGAPGVHRALTDLWPSDVELRIVPGTDRHVGRQARTNLEWAGLVVVWAATELDHKVSTLYTDGKPKNVIVATRRGIEALAERIATHLGG